MQTFGLVTQQLEMTKNLCFYENLPIGWRINKVCRAKILKTSLDKQTKTALVITPRCIASLIEDLLMEKKYKYFLRCRFQTDCLKLSFWTCRQMSGGRFLFGLREMQVSEKILLIMSLLTASINIWNEDISPDANNESMWREFEHDLELLESDIDSFLLDE